ncbi:MAG: amidohydrolase family protein [Niabella sp.]
MRNKKCSCSDEQLYVQMIDTHIHIWDLTRSSYEWLHHADDLLRRTYDLHQLEPYRVEAGVKAGLLVQADNSLADTQLMLEAANATEWIKGVVGWLPLTDPLKTGRLVQQFQSQEIKFKGVRHLIHDEPDDKWLLQPDVIESLKILAAHNIPYDIVGIKADHIKTALSVAEKVPELKMVFDHLNQPPVKNKERFGDWGQYMHTAAQHNNFYVKISGLGTTAGSEDFNAENVKPYIAFALSAFGTDRCFCGGDWPVSLPGGRYTETWNIYRSVISELLDDKEAEKVFNYNAVGFYNLSVEEV